MQHGNLAIRRCAIYTRKSSEEGLEQEFNSLHAQREACQAFIASQRGEGWRLIETAYDDGGVSGGTMERPALKHLLADIGQGMIDVVVVYKVDRLTRSLADFAKMVEVFDQHGVSFVSVTQQFNTTTSMGRLTLNVLLSFAQFEREVTGERIRDKIAASKKKGMWMGGLVPVGYRKLDRRLVISESEAKIVRTIFQRYTELSSVRLLKRDLDLSGVLSRVRLAKNGIESGGKPFSRGKLYKLLANPIYIGQIRHGKTSHLGQHQAIIDNELWDRVQLMLGDRSVRRRERVTLSAPSPLAGKLYDESRCSLTPTHAVKNGRRYRYYVSRDLHKNGPSAKRGWRLPAIEIERQLGAALRSILNDKSGLVEAINNLGLSTHRITPMLEEAHAWSKRLEAGDLAPVLMALVDRAELRDAGIELSMSLGTGLDGDVKLQLSRTIPMRMKRRGLELRLVVSSDAPSGPTIDKVLLKTVARAYRWFEDLTSGEVPSIQALAIRENVSPRFVGRAIRLAFLSPEIVESIVEGRQPPGLTTELLTKRVRLPLQWAEQNRVLALD